MPRRPPPRHSGPPSQPSTPDRRRSSAAHLGHGREPKMAVLAAANRIRDATGTPGALAGSRNASGAQAPLVVESQRYEEWMKIATDNKITSNNTWNLALIDYFHDMSLLRNGDDNSINFQKASCTLDGCVKIWTSRVDSVATETGKLLSGLGEGADAGGDEEMDEDEDGDDEEREQKRAKKRAARAATTLADSFSKLRVKSFDLEFTVDPLFKKTSADFDEGGAAGLLMNHLAVDGGMRVVFDAGDARLEMDEEDQSPEEREEIRKREAREKEEEGEREVPIAELFKCFTPTASSVPLSSRAPAPASTLAARLASMSLCPSLSAFRFSAADGDDTALQSLNLGLLGLNLDDGEDVPLPLPRKNAHLADDDGEGGGFGGGYDGNDDFGGGFDDDAGLGGAGGEVDFFADEFTPAAAYEAGLLPTPPSHLSGGGAGAGGYTHGTGVEPFDPRAVGAGQDRELVLAMQDGVGEDEGAGVLEYFDAQRGRGKGWAGPEHWKMARRRGVKAPAPVDPDASIDEDTPATGAAGAKKKREKAVFSFDFTQPAALSAKELFAPAAPKSSITASAKRTKKATTAAGEEEDYTLPADYGFNSQVLLRLFLKPKMTLRMRRRALVAGNLPDGTAGADADVQFWAQAGAGGPADGMGMGMGMGMEGDMGGFDGGDFGGGFDGPAGGDDDDDPPPFDTQWLASGDGDADIAHEADADADAAERELDDLAAASQGQVKRARPETVNYAKRAKRVDVKRLKESIWRELEEVVIKVKEFPKELQYDAATAPPAPVASKPAKKKSKAPREALLPVVSSLRKQYPRDKMSEISTSYMFICLLHLANEKGLRIQTPAYRAEDGEDVAEEGEEMRRIVGGLEGLRVMREVEEF
ncbi:hypothetical protein JCM10207_003652 [Rhodosporidiobolus poonsookiae]